MFKLDLLRTASLLCLLTIGLTIQAQEWIKEDLSAIDQRFMENQRERINDLTQRHFGRHITGHKSNDFPLMQRLLDEQLVTRQDRQTLQAMGVIFGDALRKEYFLSWTIYTDKYGRSRALNIPKQRDVVFPITMISRRAEAGAKVNIEKVYAKAVANVERIKKQIVVY